MLAAVTIVVLILLLALIGPALLGIFKLILMLLGYIERIAIITSFLAPVAYWLKNSLLFHQGKDYTSSNSRDTMSPQEAAELLGVTLDSSKSEVEEAFKRLIKLNHPDKGGSKYIASKLIQARETLIRRRKK